jgi:hypothetical protein
VNSKAVGNELKIYMALAFIESGAKRATSRSFGRGSRIPHEMLGMSRNQSASTGIGVVISKRAKAKRQGVPVCPHAAAGRICAIAGDETAKA